MSTGLGADGVGVLVPLQDVCDTGARICNDNPEPAARGVSPMGGDPHEMIARWQPANAAKAAANKPGSHIVAANDVSPRNISKYDGVSSSAFEPGVQAEVGLHRSDKPENTNGGADGLIHDN